MDRADFLLNEKALWLDKKMHLYLAKECKHFFSSSEIIF